MKKKGRYDIGSLPSIGIAFIIIGIILGAGALVLSEFAERTQTTTDTRVNNWTISYVSPTVSWYIPESTIATFNSMSTSVIIVNGTSVDSNGYILIDSGNYTAYSNGSIILTSITSYNNLTYGNITYTYTLDDNPTPFKTTSNATKGIGEIASFMPTIGIILAIAIIIGIVMYSLGKKR